MRTGIDSYIYSMNHSVQDREFIPCCITTDWKTDDPENNHLA